MKCAYMVSFLYSPSWSFFLFFSLSLIMFLHPTRQLLLLNSYSCFSSHGEDTIHASSTPSECFHSPDSSLHDRAFQLVARKD